MPRLSLLRSIYRELLANPAGAGVVTKATSALVWPLAQVQSPFGFALSGPAHNAIMLALLGYGDIRTYEPMETFLVLVTTNAGGTFFDIGANIGYFSLLVACNSPRPVQVIAFEPLEDNFRCLQHNIGWNGKDRVILPYRMGLGDRNSEELLSRYSTGASFVRGWDLGQADEQGFETVEVRRLDGMFSARDIRPPIVFKIDVEGFEAAVVVGAADLLRSKETACVLIEVGHAHHPGGFNESAFSTLGTLEDYGFDCYGIQTDPTSTGSESVLVPFPDVDRHDAERWPSSWIALRQNHPVEGIVMSSLPLYPLYCSSCRLPESDLQGVLDALGALRVGSEGVPSS